MALRARKVSVTFEKRAPGPCFSKVPKSFRTRKAVAKSQTLWLQSCVIHIFLIWTEVPFSQEVSGWYVTYPFLGADEPKMSLRAFEEFRNLTGNSTGACNNNLLLTEREGRTEEYWSEVVTVRTERCEVRTKTTEGQYSPIRLELARLVSSLLYGPCAMLICFLLERTSGHMNSKGFRRNVFLMTRATQKEQDTMLNINMTSRRFYKQTEKCKHAEFSRFKKSIFFVFVSRLSGLRLVQFLCRAREPVTCVSQLVRLSIFQTHCPWVCWMDILSHLSIRCIVCWKLEIVASSYFCPFFCVCSDKFGQKVVKLRRR